VNLLHIDANPDLDSTYHPDDSAYYLMRIRNPTFHLDVDPNLDSSFQIKAQTNENVLK
jgi:hypothetical protein